MSEFSITRCDHEVSPDFTSVPRGTLDINLGESVVKDRGLKVMKISKFQIAVLVLLAVTVIYAIALCQDVLAYEKWKPYWETRQE